MQRRLFNLARHMLGFTLFVALVFSTTTRAQTPVQDDPVIVHAHGFALYGDLKYPADFHHFDYVNPDAPKGGAITLMASGTFDTLNPYTLKGTSPINTPGFFLYDIGEQNETLLAGTESPNRSGDEPQSAYGLIAESIDYPKDLHWVIFNLRPQARFHDGEAIDADDVLFSYQTLLAKGHPRYQQLLQGVEKVEKLGARQVKVIFKQAHAGSDLLRFGEMPILPEHYWRSRDFEKATLEPPLLSGPYRIGKVRPGQSIQYERVADFWGKDLPIYRGRFNFDKVTFDFYRDLTVAFEAFKGGQFDVFLDYTSKNWATGYDFPAVTRGDVIKQAIHHQLPGNTQAIFFNSRRTKFADARVREALAGLFDFEWTNHTLFYDAYVRSQSYFPNTDFASSGIPQGEELALLEPYRKELPPELFTQAFKLPTTDGSGNIRRLLSHSLQLLKQAGWELRDGRMRRIGDNGGPGDNLDFEILMVQKGLERVWLPYAKNLERIGVNVSLRLVDPAQYKVRLDEYDYDAMTFVLPQSLTPGQELWEYFHSKSAAIPGNRNYAGIRNPVVDALVEKIPYAETREQLINEVRALDRVLLWQHYILPNWHTDQFRAAWWNKFQRPGIQPPYTLGFENWWIDPQHQNSPKP